MQPIEKFLLTVEFRYNDAPKYEDEAAQYITRTITLGVFDTRDEANTIGNNTLEIFEKYFKLNPNWNKKERFSNKGGCFGLPKDLVSNLAYLQTPFDFYVKVIQLKYFDVEQAIIEAIEASRRYRISKSENK